MIVVRVTDQYVSFTVVQLQRTKTPFCSDGDYLPPSCPAGGLYYTTPDYNRRQQEAAGGNDGFDAYGDICASPSGASSGTGSHGRKRRQRPLAFAVGYGNDWKDQEGRHVVITPSSSRLPQYHPSPVGAIHGPTRCTCEVPVSNNSLLSPEKDSRDGSPHQTKPVICKHCTSKLHDLEVPASNSSGTISSCNVRAFS